MPMQPADLLSVIVKNTTPAPQATTGGGNVGIPDVSKLYESERAAVFAEFAKLTKEIADVKISKEELEAEKASIKSRLDSARSDKLIAMLLGAAGNPTAGQFAQAAAESENLLVHLYDAINNNPAEYIRRKKQEAAKEVAGFAQGIGALIASGGQSKAEALNAFANFRNALANAAGVGAQYAAANSKRYGDEKLTFAELYMGLLQSGAPKKVLKAYEKIMNEEVNSLGIY